MSRLCLAIILIGSALASAAVTVVFVWDRRPTVLDVASTEVLLGAPRPKGDRGFIGAHNDLIDRVDVLEISGSATPIWTREAGAAPLDQLALQAPDIPACRLLSIAAERAEGDRARLRLTPMSTCAAAGRPWRLFYGRKGEVPASVEIPRHKSLAIRISGSAPVGNVFGDVAVASAKQQAIRSLDIESFGPVRVTGADLVGEIEILRLGLGADQTTNEPILTSRFRARHASRIEIGGDDPSWGLLKRRWGEGIQVPSIIVMAIFTALQAWGGFLQVKRSRAKAKAPAAGTTAAGVTGEQAAPSPAPTATSGAQPAIAGGPVHASD